MNLDEIKRRHAAATRGPWIREHADALDRLAILGAEGTWKGHRARLGVLRMYPIGYEKDENGCYRFLWDETNREKSLIPITDAQVDADAEFVAHSWEDIADLVAEVERLRDSLRTGCGLAEVHGADCPIRIVAQTPRTEENP